MIFSFRWAKRMPLRSVNKLLEGVVSEHHDMTSVAGIVPSQVFVCHHQNSCHK